MRKLSELLEICCKYHRGFTGDGSHSQFMCVSAIDAGIRQEISYDERLQLTSEINKHLDQICTNKPSTLLDCISSRLNTPIEECEYLVPMIYQAWIDRLKEDGK